MHYRTILGAVALMLSGLYGAVASNTGAYGINFFADTQSTYYDGYQQAWRYLGWYVKCGYPSDRYDQEDSHENSHESNDAERWQGNNYCQRYLIWAAYVDESYQGGGIGEYSYYDPYAKAWDDSACEVHGNGRCAPMDCHLNNSTTWKLMGVFKEASYFGNDAFFEQLFKHEGVCLWNAIADDGNELYEFMSSARESSWTEGCVSTGVQITNAYYKYNDYYASQNTNGYLYIDLKPTWNGNMTYGLYTDSTCKYEYELPDADVDSIAKKMGLLYGEYLQTWNDGLEAFKVCQPCRAYNIRNDYATDDYSGEYNDDSDPNEGYFQCNDDADYTNVNQCMKFRTHAELEVATWEDLVTATNQGGILEVNVSGTIFGSERMSAEDYKYLIKMRQEEISTEARKATQYRMDAARVENMKPEVKTWSSMGGLSLATGLLSLLGVACLLRRKHFGRPQEKNLKKPLLAQRDYFVNGPSGSMISADLENSPSMLLPHNKTAHTLPDLDERDEVATEQNEGNEAPKQAAAKQAPATQEFLDDCASSLSSLSYISNVKGDSFTNESRYNMDNDTQQEKVEQHDKTKKHDDSHSSGLVDTDALNDVVGQSNASGLDEGMTDVELVSSYVDYLENNTERQTKDEEGYVENSQTQDEQCEQDIEYPQTQDDTENTQAVSGTGEETDVSVLTTPETDEEQSDDMEGAIFALRSQSDET